MRGIIYYDTFSRNLGLELQVKLHVMAWKEKLYNIIFKSDTREGKLFDVILLVVIVISVLAAIIESVSSIYEKIGIYLKIIEWIITIIFTFEYITRIIIVKRPWTYIFSFYGILDLLSILPSFIGIFLVGTHSLIVIRALRLLRIFRILKLTRYSKEGSIIISSLKASRVKISVFLFAVMTIVIIIGTLMYLIEGEKNGFTNIPKSIYWAIVTITTVGYGDIAPQTTLGQFLASFSMIIGYAIIAVPTGIVTNEIIREVKQQGARQEPCEVCQKTGHDRDAHYCKYCGNKLPG